jgi:hypothetical protein
MAYADQRQRRRLAPGPGEAHHHGMPSSDIPDNDIVPSESLPERSPEKDQGPDPHTIQVAAARAAAGMHQLQIGPDEPETHSEASGGTRAGGSRVPLFGELAGDYHGIYGTTPASQDRRDALSEFLLDRGRARDADAHGEDVPRPGDGQENPPAADHSQQAEDQLESPGRPDATPDSFPYDPRTEAQQAMKIVVDLLQKVLAELRSSADRHRAEVGQSASLADALHQAEVAVGAMSRTAEAQLAELKAGGSGTSLVVVLVMQKQAAEGATEDAVLAADGKLKTELQKAFGKLGRVGEWLWNMIAHLVTVREWSLGTELRIPGIAKASFTVTFGT